MDPIIKEQILAVRDTCETNMFDVSQITRIAIKMEYYELVNYLQEHKIEYSNFIIWGEQNR
ncbi:MAG: DUF5049 domain-containing protein [Hespellia sp.]|nr:DUF5049 domain-containing protein [Hespellia sp.]